MRILLSSDTLKITKVLTEKRAKENFIDGDSICLDAHTEDASGKKCDVEVFLAHDSSDAPQRPEDSLKLHGHRQPRKLRDRHRRAA